jgi:hypothetical protein
VEEGILQVSSFVMISWVHLSVTLSIPIPALAFVKSVMNDYSSYIAHAWVLAAQPTDC